MSLAVDRRVTPELRLVRPFVEATLQYFADQSDKVRRSDVMYLTAAHTPPPARQAGHCREDPAFFADPLAEPQS